MTDQEHKSIQLGDRVRILNTNGVTGRVVELRGPLGPKGAQVYSIQLRGKPKPSYVEVLEAQLEVISTTAHR